MDADFVVDMCDIPYMYRWQMKQFTMHDMIYVWNTEKKPPWSSMDISI